MIIFITLLTILFAMLSIAPLLVDADDDGLVLLAD